MTLGATVLIPVSISETMNNNPNCKKKYIHYEDKLYIDSHCCGSNVGAGVLQQAE